MVNVFLSFQHKEIENQLEDVDEFYDFQKMLKEMPTFASKHQLRLINWVNSIDE